MQVLAETLYHYEQITYEEMVHVLNKMDYQALEELRPNKTSKGGLVKDIGIYPRDIPLKVKVKDAKIREES